VSLIANILTGFVALCHLGFLVLGMFFGTIRSAGRSSR